MHIPYPGTYEGRSFHLDGRFIMKLREAASRAKGVEMIETNLVQADSGRRITGVTISRKSKVDGQDSKESLCRP